MAQFTPTEAARLRALALLDQLAAHLDTLRVELTPTQQARLAQAIDLTVEVCVETMIAQVAQRLDRRASRRPAASLARPAPAPLLGDARRLAVTPGRCCWRRRDGRRCGRPAPYVVRPWGGYACRAHAPELRARHGPDVRPLPGALAE